MSQAENLKLRACPTFFSLFFKLSRVMRNSSPLPPPSVTGTTWSAQTSLWWGTFFQEAERDHRIHRILGRWFPGFNVWGKCPCFTPRQVSLLLVPDTISVRTPCKNRIYCNFLFFKTRRLNAENQAYVKKSQRVRF